MVQTRISDTEQVADSTATAGNWVTLDLGDHRTGVDIAVDTSGAATLTVEVSTTGEFAGEEIQADTVDYSSAATSLEQFQYRHRYVRAQVGSSLNSLEIVSRGIR